MPTSYANYRVCAACAYWDGVGELWFDSTALAEQALSTEPYRSQLIEDRNEFVGEVQYCFVEEHTVVKPP
jgi:hypothetical protein